MFSPANLFAAGENGAWYDPSDLSTMFQDAAGTIPVTAPGQPVGLIKDKSGRGNHASQTTPGNRPIYQTDGSGRSFLVFNGTSSFVTPSAVQTGSSDKMQVFCGVRKLNDAGIGCIAELRSSSTLNPGTFHIRAPATAAGKSYRFVCGGTALSGSTQVTYAAPISNVLTFTSDIGASTSSIRINASLKLVNTQTQGTGGFISYPLYIGSSNGFLLFNGNIYSLILRFGDNLSSQQISSTENWVNLATGAY